MKLENVFKIESRATGTMMPRNGGGFFDFFRGEGSTVKATTKSSFTLSAFYNGVDQLSNDLAKLPKIVMRKDGDDRHKVADHPVSYLISHRPNGLMNSFSFWKVIEVLTIIKGNAFARIIRNSITGLPDSFLLLENDDVEVFRHANKLYYKVKGETISSEDMLHFIGFSFDGIMGIGVVTFAAMQLGVALQAQTYNGEIYKDRGLTYGVIESDKPITTDNKKLISNGFTEKMNAKDTHKVPVLDEGLKYKSITVSPAEAQFIESNKQGWLQICQWLNIAPHKVKILDNANYSNVYQQSIEHVQDSIMPRVVSKEQELNNKLFTKEDAGILYTKFNIAALLRGDLTMKKEFYTAMVNFGIYTPNEVRALEDMNPLPGLDEPLRPVNLQSLSQIALNQKKEKNENN